MKNVFWVISIFFSVMTGGCATVTGTAPVVDRSATGMSGTSTEESPGIIEVPGPAGRGDEFSRGKIAPDPATSPAVAALLSQADANLRSGNAADAAATVERALYLEPKDAYLWYRLAEIRLRQNNWQQAYVLATKSNSLAAGNKPLQMANWEIIALAKKMQGDAAGVELAAKEIEKLKRQ